MNVETSAWDELKLSKETWLDKMNAEIVVVQNSKFACCAGNGAEGGSMIDYFIMTKPLAALIRFVGAIMDAPWGPHFGLTLTMFGKPSEVMLHMFVKPALPDNFLEVMKPKAVAKAKSDNGKISRQREREDEAAKAVSENASKARTWCSNFLETSYERTAFDDEDTA